MSNGQPPPAIIATALIEYAVVEGCAFAGKTYHYVDGIELGRVPGLAICGPDRSGEILLIHCDSDWESLGVSAFKTVDEARRKAERIYPGVAERWRTTPYQPADIVAYLDALFDGLCCSVCGRSPLHFASLVVGPEGVGICDECLAAQR